MTCVILNRWAEARKENKITMKLSGNRLGQKIVSQSLKLKNQVKIFVLRFFSAELNTHPFLPSQHLKSHVQVLSFLGN